MLLFINLCLFLFFLALFGLLFKTEQKVLKLLIFIELLLLSSNLFFILGSIYLDVEYGAVFSLFILSVAAAESAIGLAVFIVAYRIKGNIPFLSLNEADYIILHLAWVYGIVWPMALIKTFLGLKNKSLRTRVDYLFSYLLLVFLVIDVGLFAYSDFVPEGLREDANAILLVLAYLLGLLVIFFTIWYKYFASKK